MVLLTLKVVLLEVAKRLAISTGLVCATMSKNLLVLRKWLEYICCNVLGKVV
jgi:hypothetical protein